MIDAMRACWMTRVVGYDLRAQMRGLRELRDFFKRFSLGRVRSASAERGGAALKTRWSGLSGSWPLLGAGAILLTAVGFFALRRRRRGSTARGLTHSARVAQELYRELELALAKRGSARPPHVTPEAHARDAAGERLPRGLGRQRADRGVPARALWCSTSCLRKSLPSCASCCDRSSSRQTGGLKHARFADERPMPPEKPLERSEARSAARASGARGGAVRFDRAPHVGRATERAHRSRASPRRSASC